MTKKNKFYEIGTWSACGWKVLSTCLSFVMSFFDFQTPEIKFFNMHFEFIIYFEVRTCLVLSGTKLRTIKNQVGAFSE